MLDLEDPANRRVVDYFARRNERGEPLDEPAYYPPIGRLTTHPDVLEHLWKTVGSLVPPETARFVNGVPALVHQGRGIILAFGWGTAYALRLLLPDLVEAGAAGFTTRMKWSGGRVTDLEEDLGPGWVWGRFQKSEPAWLEAAYRAVS